MKAALQRSCWTRWNVLSQMSMIGFYGGLRGRITMQFGRLTKRSAKIWAMQHPSTTSSRLQRLGMEHYKAMTYLCCLWWYLAQPASIWMIMYSAQTSTFKSFSASWLAGCWSIRARWSGFYTQICSGLEEITGAILRTYHPMNRFIVTHSNAIVMKSWIPFSGALSHSASAMMTALWPCWYHAALRIRTN